VALDAATSAPPCPAGDLAKCEERSARLAGRLRHGRGGRAGDGRAGAGRCAATRPPPPAPVRAAPRRRVGRVGRGRCVTAPVCCGARPDFWPVVGGLGIRRVCDADASSPPCWPAPGGPSCCASVRQIGWLSSRCTAFNRRRGDDVGGARCGAARSWRVRKGSRPRRSARLRRRPARPTMQASPTRQPTLRASALTVRPHAQRTVAGVRHVIMVIVSPGASVQAACTVDAAC